MKNIIRFALALSISFAMLSCSKSDSQTQEGSGDGVPVYVNVQCNEVTTKAAFAENTTLTLYVFARYNNSSVDLSLEPVKVATATADGSQTSFDFTVDGAPLTVTAGYTYDFVVVANMPATSTLSNGSLSGVTNGVDFMAGRCTNIAVGDDATSVTISFSGADAVAAGADASGNLPHLVCNCTVQASATQNFIDYVGTNGSVDVALSSVSFSTYPTRASLALASSPMSLSTTASAAYDMVNADSSTTTTLDDTSDVAVYSQCMLPYPVVGANTTNIVDIDFYLAVNGSTVPLHATAVQLPAFRAGYNYTFNVSFDAEAEDATIALYLSVDTWDDLSWNTGMGGSDVTVMNLLIGSWSSISWSAGMGADGSDDKIITSVSGWSSVTWSSNVGGTNTDNGTNN